MFGSLYCVARHLSFDDARVRTMASWRQKFEQHLRRRLTMSGVKYLTGKNQGRTLCCGAPPGGCE
jgi:hypothetical protein